MTAQDLPLYRELPKVAIETCLRLPIGPACNRCARGGLPTRTRCMPADGESGGVFLVGKMPGRHEDAIGRPNVGDSGTYLRRMVAGCWTGPVAYDNAVRCYGGGEPTDEHIDACRPYLARVLDEAKAQRIVALGAEAALALLGRVVQPFSARRGYAFLSTGVPVFFVTHPAAALRNRFVKGWFEDDLRWSLTSGPPPPPPWAARVRLVTSAEDAARACAELRAACWFAFDTETFGEMFNSGFRVDLLSACAADTDDAWVWDRKALTAPAMRDPIMALLADPAVHKVGQNIKFDLLAVRCAFGVRVRGVHLDVRLVRKLLESDAAADLETMAELVGMGGHKAEMETALDAAVKKVRAYQRAAVRESQDDGLLFPTLTSAEDASIRLGVDPLRYAYALTPSDVLMRYGARDAVATARLGSLVESRLDAEPELSHIWRLVVKRTSEAVARMEEWGIAADVDAMRVFSAYLGLRLDESRKRIAAYNVENPNSTSAIADLLFRKLHLRSVKDTPGGSPSTDDSVLRALKGKHPVVADLLDWRRLSKLKGTYADGLIVHVRDDGRIHPCFKIDGARSGRYSCENPNLQNITRASTPDGKMARDCFVAPPGFVLLSFDYSQLELRVAAMLSGDQKMADIFRRGEDYHLRTAQMFARRAWGINPSAITDEHRVQAKIVNFRVLYGTSPRALAAEMGVSEEEAQRLMDVLFGAFPDLTTWIHQQLESARRTGICWTWWAGQRARRRSLWRIADADSEARGTAERSSWNTPVQGSGADYCNASVVAVVDWIESDCVPAELNLAVHDDLVLTVREDAVDEVLCQVSRIMTGWPSGDVPLKVDAKCGRSWGSMKGVEIVA